MVAPSSSGTRFLALLFLSSLAVTACTAPRGGGRGGGDDDGGGDSDGDGLTDSFESTIGTDADNADTDGDGWEDAREHLAYFDATDPDDFPYEGGYPRLPLPDSIDSNGWDEGDVSNDWSEDVAIDRFGETVNLHRFYGNVVVMEVAAEWCGPCRAAAPGLQAMYEQNRSRGFVMIHAVLDGLNPSQEPNLDRWTTDLSLTFPVFGDHQQEVVSNYINSPDGSFGIPNYTIFGRDLRIEAEYMTGGLDEGFVLDLLDEDPPQVEWPLPENAAELRDDLGIETLDVDYLIDSAGE